MIRLGTICPDGSDVHQNMNILLKINDLFFVFAFLLSGWTWLKVQWLCGRSSLWIQWLWLRSVNPHPFRDYWSLLFLFALIPHSVLFFPTQCISLHWFFLWVSRWPAIGSTSTRLPTQRYGATTQIILTLRSKRKGQDYIPQFPLFLLQASRVGAPDPPPVGDHQPGGGSAGGLGVDLYRHQAGDRLHRGWERKTTLANCLNSSEIHCEIADHVVFSVFFRLSEGDGGWAGKAGGQTRNYWLKKKKRSNC